MTWNDVTKVDLFEIHSFEDFYIACKGQDQLDIFFKRLNEHWNLTVSPLQKQMDDCIARILTERQLEADMRKIMATKAYYFKNR